MCISTELTHFFCWPEEKKTPIFPLQAFLFILFFFGVSSIYTYQQFFPWISDSISILDVTFVIERGGIEMRSYNIFIGEI